MDKETSMNLGITRLSNFSPDFAKYHAGEERAVLRKELRDRKYTVSKTSVAYRVINSWDENGLLPKVTKNKDGWRKFNFIELVWVHVIRNLREFGFGLEKIARARDCFLDYDESGQETYPTFEYYIARALCTDADPYVIVSANGIADIGTAQEVELAKPVLSGNGMLLISINHILGELGLKPRKSASLVHLTQGEQEVLESIRLENADEIKAKINNKDVTEIESTFTSTEPPKNYEIHKNAKEKRMFGRVITQYEDGNPQSVQLVRRRRLKK